MENVMSRVTKWMSGEKAPPSVIELFTARGCNQKCRFCGSYPLPFNEASWNPKNNSMDEDFFRFIREASELKVDEIRICGDGEPLFRKDSTMKMISLIKKYGMRSEIITNGTLFTDDDIKKLVELGMDGIHFSIHGPDAATHDYLVRLPGAFDKVVHNIRRFNYWKQKLKKDKPNLTMMSVVNNINYNKLDKMILLAKELNLVFLHFFDLEIRSEEGKKLKLNEFQKNEIRRNFGNLEKMAERSGVKFHFPDTILYKEVNNKNFTLNLSNKKSKNDTNTIINLLNIDKSKNDLLNVPCYESWYYLAINSSGEIEICPSISNKPVKIKLDENTTIKDAWYGKQMEKVRRIILEKKISGKCQFCCHLSDTFQIREGLKNPVSKINV